MHYYSSFKFQHIHINTCINCVSASPTHNYNIVINVHITSNNYIYHYSCRLEVNIQPWEIERRNGSALNGSVRFKAHKLNDEALRKVQVRPNGKKDPKGILERKHLHG